MDAAEAGTPSLTGADALAAALRSLRIARLYVHPDEGVLPLLSAWIASGGGFVLTHHVQSAGYAALAEARISGRAQVSMVNGGPELTHLASTVADAWAGATPLVVLTTTPASTCKCAARRDEPSAALFESITKECIHLGDPNEISAGVARAFHVSVSGRPGPVILSCAEGLFATPFEVCGEPATQPRDSHCYTPSPDSDQMFLLAEMLREVERPLLLAGHDVARTGAFDALREFAERHQLPVATTLLGIGSFPSTHTLSLGHVGPDGMPWANRAVSECDLLLVLGARLGEPCNGGGLARLAPRGQMVRIDVDAEQLTRGGAHSELAFHANLRRALGVLDASLGEAPLGGYDDWNARLKEWRINLSQADIEAREGCHPATVLRSLDALTHDRDLMAITGGGGLRAWAARHLSFGGPQRILLTSGEQGAVGFDLPSAVGAAFARPDARTLCLVSDQSLRMNPQEFGTLTDYRLPVKILLLDNRGEENDGGEPIVDAARRPSLDIRTIAKEYGLRCSELSEWTDRSESTLRSFLDSEGPALLRVRIDPRCDLTSEGAA